MTDSRPDLGFFGLWPIDEVTRCFAADLANRHRLGLPTVLDAHRPQPVQAGHLLRDGVDLGPLDHPAVLSTIAVGDPFTPNAMAAAARLLPRLAGQPDGGDVAVAIARAARHDRVRETTAMVADYGFSSSALDGLRWLARRSLDDDRHAARQELIAYLDRLARSHRDPVTLIDDLLAFDYRLSLSPSMFRQLVVNLVESQKMPAVARVRVVRELYRLPRPLRLEIVTRASLLPATTHGNLAVKKALEDVMNRVAGDAVGARVDGVERRPADEARPTVDGGADPRISNWQPARL